MRVNPPVQHTERMAAAKNDVIPLSKPVKGKDGSMISSISVKKGDYLHIAILPFNHSTDIFGKDASVFRPERWLEEDMAERVKGFAAHPPNLSFLGGPRYAAMICTWAELTAFRQRLHRIPVRNGSSRTYAS